MTSLSDIGSLIRVTPLDAIYIKTESSGNYVNDLRPFEFRVEGRLEDGQIFFGIYGRVLSGPSRYHNLICNLMIREDGADWRIESAGQANFRVGPTKVERNHAYDFRHPEGTTMAGFPQISRFGEICVILPE